MQKVNTTDNLLSNDATDSIDLITVYKTADGRESLRIYLDSAASTIMTKSTYNAVEAFYNYFAITHSDHHFSAWFPAQYHEYVKDNGNNNHNHFRLEQINLFILSEFIDNYVKG